MARSLPQFYNSISGMVVTFVFESAFSLRARSVLQNRLGESGLVSDAASVFLAVGRGAIFEKSANSPDDPASRVKSTAWNALRVSALN